MPTRLVRVALLLACLDSVFALTAFAAEGAAHPCAWSAVWQALPAASQAPAASVAKPRHRKGYLRVPASDIRREIEGRWLVELVIDAGGVTRDAKVIGWPRLDPVWPEMDVALVREARKFRWWPARDGNQAVPFCLRIVPEIQWTTFR